MICIVSHDAGGAEVLASYVAQRRLHCMFVLEGPAVKVFERRMGSIDLSTLDDAVAKCDWLLCGTSWQSDIEWRSFDMGRRRGKRTVAFLDHWVHYRERFIRQGQECLPDEIWVGDEDAKMLVRKHFLKMPIRLVPNPYLIDIKREIAVIEARKTPKKAGGKRVLYICENISEHALVQHGDERYWGYTEFDAIEYFLENIKAIGGPIEAVVIRPHPSDPPGKYNRIVSEHCGLLQLSSGKLLLEEVVEADVVVGCESMALVVGSLAGKTVISAIPPSGEKCRLPLKGYSKFQELRHRA